MLERLNQNRFFKAFIRIQDSLLVVCNLSSAIIVVFNVVMRYILKKDLMGSEEILTILMIWMYCVGGAYGSYEGSHITADILSSYVKNENSLKILKFIQELVSVLVLSVVTVQVWKYLQWSLSIGAISTTLKIPMIIPQSSLGVGFTLMLVFHLLRLIDAVYSIFKRNIDEEAK